MRRRPGLVLLAFLLVAPSGVLAKESTASKLTKQVVKALEDGKAKDAASWLNPSAIELLRKDLEQTYSIAFAVRGCVMKHAEAAFDRKPFEALVKHALAMTEYRLAQQPKNRRAGFAHGHALRARGWLRFYEGSGGTEDWEKAFDILAGIAKHDAWSGGTLSVAAGYLHEAAGLDGAPADALLARAAEVTQAAVRANPLHARAQGAFGWTRYLQAQRALAGRKKADAKAWTKEALAALQPAAEAESDRQSALLTDYHWVARFAAREKFVKSPPILTRTRKVRYHYLSYELPRGGHWRVTHSKAKKTQLLTTLKRTDRGGVSTIKVYRYWWSTNYEAGDAVMGGDNLKGLMEQDRKAEVNWLKKIKRQRKLVRGRLSRTIPKTTGFEILGETDGGSRYWTQVWYFKSEYKDATLSIVANHQGEFAGKDIELETLLDSMTQLPMEKD